MKTKSDIDYQITLKTFNNLSPNELYQIMRLRIEVFVIEQQCFYQDADNKDQHSHHLMIWKGETLAAYARILPAGLSFPEVSIGRVITSPEVRGSGAGKILMRLAIEKARALYGNVAIRIGAQSYAKVFYSSLGFVATDIEYIEDDIPHIEMVCYPN